MTKKYLLILLLALPILVNAFDVRNFEIKGIKVGDNINNVKLPCTTGKKHYYPDGNLNAPYTSYCDIVTNTGKEGYRFDVGSDKKIYSLGRTIYFKSNPNWDKLKERIISQYGLPDKEGESYFTKGDISVKTLCWGDGCLQDEFNKYWRGKGYYCNNHSRNDCFSIFYEIREGTHHINFSIEDYNLRIKAKRTSEKMREDIQKRKEQQSTNISF